MKKNNDLIKNMAIGLAVGATAAAVGNKVMEGKPKRKMKKMTNKAVKTVSSAIDNINYMMK